VDQEGLGTKTEPKGHPQQAQEGPGSTKRRRHSAKKVEGEAPFLPRGGAAGVFITGAALRLRSQDRW